MPKIDTGNKMLTAEQLAEIRWRCRRGMWELDRLLIPFFEHQFSQLSTSQQNDFIELLNCPDQALFDRFFNKKSLNNNKLNHICDVIHNHIKGN